MPVLLRIMDYLGGTELTQHTFMKPSLDNGIKLLLVEPTDESPPASKMALRLMTLLPGAIVPFHVHRDKEKVYEAKGDGCLEVLVYENGGMKKYHLLRPDQLLVIPPNREHALIYYGKSPGNFLVITSSQDATDCDWESETSDLIQNKHLNIE